jgi:hypothetical protein
VRGAHTEAAVDGSKAMAIVEIVEKSAILCGRERSRHERRETGGLLPACAKIGIDIPRT